MNDLNYKNMIPNFLRKIVDYLMVRLESGDCKIVISFAHVKLHTVCLLIRTHFNSTLFSYFIYLSFPPVIFIFPNVP